MRRPLLARIGLSAAALGGLVLAIPALPAGASSPQLPPGTVVEPQVVSPHVYPGGGLFSYGDAKLPPPSFATRLNSPVVAMAETSTGDGYWLAGNDGGVYTFGDAAFYGSAGGLTLSAPVVGMAATPDGKGYWLVASDGGIFAYGDAAFYGSMGGTPLNQPIVGMAATPDGKGYWLVASDGGIFAYGDAAFYGSTGGQDLSASVAGMAATPDGKGYWFVAGDGQVYNYGDAGNFGELSNGTGAATPIDQLVPTPDGKGYTLLDPDAFSYSFANPPPNGTFPGSQAIVSAAESQVQPDPATGYFCNPYGPCEAWCALFATWAWQQGGWSIPSYGFVGDVFNWSAAYGTVLAPTSTPVPGDAVLYGTGPQDGDTAVHMGIVAQVWSDGSIVTIEGDAGPGQTGSLGVIINGPYLPSDSPVYNGTPIFAFAQP